MTKKEDAAPVTMAVRVEQGHLVPVSQYDVELLSRWREGAILAVQPTLTEVRPAVKHYFAMLSELLKEAETPWANTNEAHKAIKAATGFVEVYTTKRGDLRSRERHIASFTDRELERFVAAFRKLALKRYGIECRLPCGGVDRNGGVDQNDQSSGSVSLTPSPPSADDGPAASPIPAGSGEPATTYTESDMAWLKMVARMLVSATEPDGSDADFEILRRQKIAVKGLTPPTVGTNARAIAEKIYRHCQDACNGKAELSELWVAGVAGCEVADLRPEAR